MKFLQFNLVVKNKDGDRMAKDTNEKNNEVEEIEEEKKTSSLTKLLLWVIVPLLFVAAVLLIVAKVADVNVFDYAKKAIAPITKTEDGPTHGIDEEAYVELQADYQEQERQIEKLKEEIAKLEEENDKIEEEKKLEEEKSKNEVVESEGSKKDLKDIVRTYETMSSQKAADILVKMEDAQTLQILKNMKADTVASILEKMEPEQAAKYTALMTK